ncbi:hypothetical protein E6B08_26830 [Pseudomonas putida]|uniref:Tr-type G domain-containing protein n=1 Tax=Pseudomonas putida TaxID=303 RepID=A0A4D6XJR5_PSEPU|nr:GTP-binding protein [Pseudomonas putida]QCI14748.1 hypothetical protein E6B08_26830 [Pseudomonas putida]
MTKPEAATVNKVLVMGHSNHGKSTLISAFDRYMGYHSASPNFELKEYPKDSNSADSVINGTLAGAILVCDIATGPEEQTREHLKLCQNAGVPIIAVLLNKLDMVEDHELREQVEMEAVAILEEFDYSSKTPMILGSALNAGDSQDGDEWGSALITKLYGEIKQFLASQK